MNYKELIKKSLAPSLLFGVYVAVESYVLSNLIFLVLPKFWAGRSLVENTVAVIIACMAADFIFHWLTIKLKNRLIIAASVVVGTILIQTIVLALLYFFA